MATSGSDFKQFAALFRRLVVVPLGKYIFIPILLAIIGIVIVSRITNWWTGPDSYVIYLTGNYKNDPMVASIFTGFLGESCEKSAGDIKKNINTVPIKVVCLDDRGDPTEARRLSSELVHRNDTLMVVGHIYSTQTKEALPNYLRQAQPPIPVILTTETNPQLIPAKKARDDYDPVFRLAPLDDKQAARAGQFSMANGKQFAWVVEDEHNPFYSQYLALNFVRWMQRHEGKVVLWSSNMSVPSAETLKKLNIDFVFFAGDWSSALILIRQIKHIFPPNSLPALFLSDAAMNEELLAHGAKDLHGLQVYLSYPFSATQFKDSGFELIGKDTRQIIDRLLDDTSRHFVKESQLHSQFQYWSMWLLNRNEVEDARTALISRMKKADLFNWIFPGDLSNYQFNNGENEFAQWHIWQIKQLGHEKDRYQFVDVD